MNTEPWRRYSPADYSVEQWHAACLIHEHDGPPSAKTQCKLPIKTPAGAVNQNAVFAAAAALAGARTPVSASAEQKEKAARTLLRLYSEMDREPPPSLKSLAQSDISVGGGEMTILLEEKPSPEDLVHYGVKGMKWGVRRSDAELAKSRGEKRAAKKEARAKRNEEIKGARARQEKRMQEWNKAEMEFYASMIKGGRKEAYQKLSQKADAYTNNPDAKTAAKMTTGEKWLNGALIGAGGAFVVGSVAMPMISEAASMKVTEARRTRARGDQKARTRGLPQAPTRAKKNRKGVYNITTA